jgi:hypothetical protein
MTPHFIYKILTPPKIICKVNVILQLRICAVAVVVSVAACGTAAITAGKTKVKFRGPTKNKRTSNKNEVLNAICKFSYLKECSFSMRTHESFGYECVQKPEQSNIFSFCDGHALRRVQSYVIYTWDFVDYNRATVLNRITAQEIVPEFDPMKLPYFAGIS